MATQALATTAAAAAAPTLCSIQGVENSSPFRACKEFSRVCVSSGGAPALRVNAARRDVVVCAGKRNAGRPGNGKRPRSGMQARRKQKSGTVEDGDDDDAETEKALEAMFTQLEMDLNCEDDDDDGVEFTDAELEQMTKELEDAFRGLGIEGLEDGEADEDSGMVDMVMNDGVYSEASGAAEGSIQKSRKQEYEDEDEEEFEEDEDEDDELRRVPLEKWQVRKLAAAAEKGRRNVNVKSLAAELGMDRVNVLAFLKDPPPDLLLMAAQWDSEDQAAAAATPKVQFDFNVDVVDKAPKTSTPRRQPMSPPTPTGGRQVPRNWHGSKRLKKEHVATFERVYRQTSRPSNSMIENLVNLTHVPRKKILQWFDDKRAQKRPKEQSFEEAPEN